MIRRLSSLFTERLVVVLVLGVGFSVIILGWFGFRGVVEWQRTAALLADRRADEAADLLVRAISRDMRGVQTLVLSSANLDRALLDAPHGIRELVARAFALYPYPEAFFGWDESETGGSVRFLGRTERRPAWMPADDSLASFPVVIGHAPAVGVLLIRRVAADAARGARFSVFNMEIDGVTHQVVARLLYRPGGDMPYAVFGFMVDLQWARDRYFEDLTRQVTRIAGADSGLLLAVTDGEGLPVGHVRNAVGDVPGARRPFPLLFFDASLVALDAPADLAIETWTAEATIAGDPGMLAASGAARRTLGLAVLSTVVLAVALILTARTVRAHARLAEMRADFVSIATHELKTPLATIRAAGQTLALGKISAGEMLREYAEIVVQEAKRLTRLVDNLLAYARITDVADVYSFTPLAVATVVATTLREFSQQLTDGRFDVHVDVPADLPLIRADRLAMTLLLDNLVDNAIRYTGDRRRVAIVATAVATSIVLEVRDLGVGIPEEEIKHVTRKFFRGERAGARGSGLGLAIARRIAADHGGALSISSQLGEGTTVSVTLPILRADDEQAHPGY